MSEWLLFRRANSGSCRLVPFCKRPHHARRGLRIGNPRGIYTVHVGTISWSKVLFLFRLNCCRSIAGKDDTKDMYTAEIIGYLEWIESIPRVLRDRMFGILLEVRGQFHWIKPTLMCEVDDYG